MTDIVLIPVTGSSNITAMNNNFSKVQESINSNVLHTSGGSNVMSQDLDMNGNDILNLTTDVNNPNSMLTVGAGDARYYNVSGDSLTGAMNANGQHITNLPLPTTDNEPVRKGEFDVAVFSSAANLEQRLADSAGPDTGADLIGWGGDESDVSTALSSRVKGNSGVTYNMIGGAIRRDTTESPDWQFINDNAHHLSNLLTITNGVEVGITYNGSKIVSLGLMPDERWASSGVQVGASVGANSANLRMGAPCTFTVDLDTLAIGTDLRFFRVGRFGVSIASSGLITLTHPQRQLALMPVIQHFTTSSSAEIGIPFDIRASSVGVSTLFLKRRMAGRVNFTGSAWAASNTPFPNSDYTLTYDTGTGVLTVVHPQVDGNVQPMVTPYGNAAVDYVPLVLAATGTGFQVKFRKLSDGSIPVGTPTDMGFYFDRGMNAIDKTPNGKLHIDLGTVQVDMNDVDYPLGNAWIMGMMES